MPPSTEVRLIDVVRFYRELPLQTAALMELEEDIKAGRKDALSRSRPWWSTWSAAGRVVEEKRPNPLPVPWYSQRDSKTDQALRMCFSSSCAMLVEFLRPGTLKGPNGDDQYLARVQRYGDTTDAGAQLQAIGSFGVKARFVQDADFRVIEQQISRGVPVPCGYLHRGPVDRPRGGGHWLTVVGTTARGVIVHDPWGEADLITGDTIDRPARFCEYSRQNFGKRWMVQPLGGGAYRYAPGNGWAIIAEP